MSCICIDAFVKLRGEHKMPSYTTMVQHFLGTLQLPMAIYILDYYLPMLSPNDGYNETGITMQSAGPIREAERHISSKEANLATGKLQEDTTRLRSDFFFRPTPDGSRQVVYQAGKTIAFCKFTELDQWQHQSCRQCAFKRELNWIDT